MDFRRTQKAWEESVPVFPEKPSTPSGLHQALTARPVANTSTRPGPEDKLVRLKGQARVTALAIETIHRHGELYVDFLKARKAAFVDRRGWDLPCAGDMEFDQYDTPESRWIVVHEYGEVLAGVRITPSTARCGVYSYMIRDAQLGLLENIPSNILFFEAPVHAKIWEASRIFIDQSVPSERRLVLHGMLFDRMIATLSHLGASHVLGLVPAIWTRWISRLPIHAFPAGPKMRIGSEAYQVAMMNVRKNRFSA